MLADAAIAPVASLLADPARVAILFALSDGRHHGAALSDLASNGPAREKAAQVRLYSGREGHRLTQAELLYRQDLVV
jgi:hypothetical protein